MIARLFHVALAMAFALASPVAGTILYVNGDLEDGLNDGSSWSNAYRGPEALQAALDAASTEGSYGVEIWVAQGTYTPTVVPGDIYQPPDLDRAVSFELRNGVGLYGGFEGTETAREQRDWKIHETVLSCDLGPVDDNDDDDDGLPDPGGFRGNSTRSTNCYHVLIARSGSPVLDGFTVTSGQADGSSNYAPFVTSCCGGGLFSEPAASPTVRNSTFTYNAAWHEGGAIVHRGPITVIDSQFKWGYGEDGGAIWSGPPHLWPAGATESGGLIRGSSFEGNVASAEGGAFMTYNSKNVYENCRIIGNRSITNGGAMTLGSGHTVVRNCLIADNVSEGQIGTAGGGAIRLTTFGGLDHDHELVNVTVVDNHAGNRGGGLSVNASSAPAMITITNSIFWENTADPGSGEEVYIQEQGTVNFRYSLVEGGICTGSGCSILQEPGGVLDNQFEVTGDPVLSQGPGGATYHLGANSVAIDAGDPDRSYLGQVDIDGEPRVMGACTPLPDLGADEDFYPECWNSVSNCLGDVDQDGLVTPLDLSAWAEAASASPADACGDINRDGLVNVNDAGLVALEQTTVPSSCTCGAPWPF